MTVYPRKVQETFSWTSIVVFHDEQTNMSSYAPEVDRKIFFRKILGGACPFVGLLHVLTPLLWISGISQEIISQGGMHPVPVKTGHKNDN